MTCIHCGGLVVWRGRITDLTHTQCVKCGAINCQVIDPEDDATEGETE